MIDVLGRSRFVCPTEVRFGRGTISLLGPSIVKLGGRRVVILAADAIVDAIVRPLIATLEGSISFQLQIWNGEEPSDELLDPHVSAALTYLPDVVVAIGGGSVIDAAKVISASIAAQTGAFRELLSPGHRAVETCLPLIAVPTTSGAGAEVTRGTVVIDNEKGYKRGFSKGGCYARLALLDPALTDNLPSGPTATSGLDAFCHALESYLSPQCFNWADAFALHAMELIGSAYLSVNTLPTFASRDAMMMAAWMAALCFSTGGGLTFAHGFSDIAGPRFKLPHSYAAGLLLPGIVDYAAHMRPHRVARAANAIDPTGSRTLMQSTLLFLDIAKAPKLPELMSSVDAASLAEEARLAQDDRDRPSKEFVADVVQRTFDITKRYL